MKYKISIITMALFLAGCSAPPLSPTSTLAPTQTYTPAPTATIPSTATLVATATVAPTATPETSQFKVCNKIENYADCPITVDDLFNGNYLWFLQTLSKPFDPLVMKSVPFFVDKDFPVPGGLIVYDETHLPNSVDKSTRPFRRDVTFGEVLYVANEAVYPYVVKPIEYPDPKDPSHSIWVISVESYYVGPDAPVKARGMNDHTLMPAIKGDNEVWRYSMDITPIAEGYVTPFSSGADPLVKRTFDTIGAAEMQNRFDRFVAGDPSALSGPGIVVLTATFDSSDKILK